LKSGEEIIFYTSGHYPANWAVFWHNLDNQGLLKPETKWWPIIKIRRPIYYQGLLIAAKEAERQAIKRGQLAGVRWE